MVTAKKPRTGPAAAQLAAARLEIAAATERAEIAEARLEATQKALRRVLATLAASAGGPDETRVWDEARALLAADAGPSAEDVAAYEAWEARRAR